MATKEILPIAFPYTSEFVEMAPDGLTPIYDRAVGSEAYKETWNSFFTQGVFDSVVHFRVSPVGGLYIEVSTGSAFIDGVTIVSKNVVTLLVENPSVTEDRIDRVVIQNNYIDRYTYVYIKRGDTALIRTDEIYEIGIADILVRQNIIALTEADITDLRAKPEYCGSVKLKPAEDWVSWAALFESFKAKLGDEFMEWFESIKDILDENMDVFRAWFDSIKDILDENVAATLLNMINETNTAVTRAQSTADGAQSTADTKAPNILATQSLNGLMSALDKTKLDGITAGATAIVAGMYTGDNQESRLIELGFAPKAVFVIPNNANFISTSGTTIHRVRGGLAVTNSNTNGVSIQTNGFTIGYTPGTPQYGGYYPSTNEKNTIYNYIAFK